MEEIRTRRIDIESLEKAIVVAAYDAVETYYTDKNDLARTMEKLADAIRKHRERLFQ